MTTATTVSLNQHTMASRRDNRVEPELWVSTRVKKAAFCCTMPASLCEGLK
jgi:hypothetical protein